MIRWHETTPRNSDCPRWDFTGEASETGMPARVTIQASAHMHGFWTVRCAGLSEELRFYAQGVEGAQAQALKTLAEHIESLYVSVHEALRQARALATEVSK